MNISIAMATYNGGRFLKEQLDSLAFQTHLPYELVVCDDGSTDETLELIAEFAMTALFPVRVYRNEENLGYARNFLKAARLCEGHWISFCDQDDVWLPNKLDDVREAVARDSRPIMILQNAYLCEADLSHRNKLFPDRLHAGYHGPQSQFGFWVWPGFVKTIHSSILVLLDQEALPRSYFPKDGSMTHDKWTCMVANVTGGIFVLREPAALYRRHENALTGSYADQTFKKRVGNALPVAGNHYRFLSEVAEESGDYLSVVAAYAFNEYGEDFVLASRGFARIAKIYDTRAQLYDAESPLHRAARFIEILKIGGYLGRPMISLGWKSLLKDLLRVFGVISTAGQNQ
jgi:glycosyltransferase involved in cell wall biosynthesis